MYRVDIKNQKITKIPTTSFGELNLKERFDIQEWIATTPGILGEELLIIGKEVVLPSGKRLDLLSVDKKGKLVVIELKRDNSGSDVEWQAIKYVSYCSSFSQDQVYERFAEYLETDITNAQLKIEEFIDCESEELNKQQRIILVSKKFHPEVISAVLWLRESEIDIECISLTPHQDAVDNLFINPQIIIPLPEAKDYIQKKENKQKKQGNSSVSYEKSNLSPSELKLKIIKSLTRQSPLTPRLHAFLEIISKEDRIYDREEIMQGFYEVGISDSIGKAGSYLSNISQFLTKKSTPHLRQAIEFERGGGYGETKNNYHVVSSYRSLILDALKDSELKPERELQTSLALS